MDDKKIIVFGSGHLRNTMTFAKLLGEALHAEVVRQDDFVKPKPINLDFSELETKILGMYDAVLEDGTAMLDIKTGRIVKGRDMYITPDVAASNRLFAQGYRPDLMIWDEFNYPKLQKPADHPSRKREPKGPRGKWGKL